MKRLPAMEGASNAKRRHLLFPQASTDKDEGAIRKDRAFRFHMRRFFATISHTVNNRDTTRMPEICTPRRGGVFCASTVGHESYFRAGLTASFCLLFVLPCFAMTVRTMSDMRLWMTVGDRSAPLSWIWDESADAASLVLSNRITGAVSEFDVARGEGDTHGSCPQPAQISEALVDVTLVQSVNGSEVSRQSATLAYVDGAGGGPITVRAKTYGEWCRVRSPRVFAFDPAWSGGAGESGYDIAPPYDPAISIRIR